MTGSVYDWLISPDGNASSDGDINWAEFQDPGTVNNSARRLMGRFAEWRADLAPTRTSTGAANIYTVTTNSVPSTAALPNGFAISFIAHQTNTGAATLKVNSFAAVNLRGTTGVALTTGQIQVGQVVTAYYNQASNEFLAPATGAQSAGFLTGLQSVDLTARIVKVGSVMIWPTATIPAGWLECNGAAVSRTTYPELFTAYGTNYGAGDGVTTFNIPNYRGQFLRGWSHASGADPNAATRTDRGDGTGGDNVGTKQGSDYLAHSHVFSGTAAGTVSGTVSSSFSSGSVTGSISGGTISGTAASAGAHAHNVLGASDSASGATVTIAAAGGTASSNATSTAGAHTHSVSGSCSGSVVGSCTGTVTSSLSAAFSSGTCSGTTNASPTSVGAETRPTNINVVYCCLASPAAAAAGALGTNGLQYLWDTGTADADPGNGRLRLDNATVASATTIYISKTDAVNGVQTTNLAALFGSASSVKGAILINKVGAQGTVFSCLVTAIDTSPTNYIRLTITSPAINSAFVNGDSLGVQISRTGDPGAQGSKGAVTVANGLNSNIAMPGNSSVRLTGPTLAFSVGGFTGGVDGQVLRLYNTVAQTMTIVNADASSTVANRIKTLTGANVVLRAAATSFAIFEYDGTESLWILASTN